jgi:hypothetical protein
MTSTTSATGSTLLQEIEARVRQTTSDRVRGLLVEEIDGRVVLSGRVPSRYTKQLALHAALELISSGDRFRERIVVMV